MTTPITNHNDETTPIEFVFDTEFVSKIWQIHISPTYNHLQMKIWFSLNSLG